MVILYSIINVLLTVLGINHSFKKKSLMIYIWIILFYYSITSIVSIYGSQNTGIPYRIKLDYAQNVCFCLLGMFIAELIFNRFKFTYKNLGRLFNSKHKQILRIIEYVYWISLFGTFVELIRLDYNSYNNGVGGGWFQAIFQSTSCIMFYFAYKKKWAKIIFASVFIMIVVAIIHVRSLIYFIFLPLIIYYIYYIIFRVTKIKQLIKMALPLAILCTALICITGLLRFGKVELPETILTDIAMNVDYKTNYPPQLGNSILHYFTPYLNPFINALKLIGIDVNQITLLPSVPKINAMVQCKVGEISAIPNGAHMPATLFFDFKQCWGAFAGVAAFLTMAFIIEIIAFVQKYPKILFCFSGIFGWHYYMLLRGAVDTCSGGIAYSFWLCVILCIMYNRIR